MTLWDQHTVELYVGLNDESRLSVLHPALERACGAVSGRRVLDFGCGDGRFAARIGNRGAEVVTCIDNNEWILHIAERNVRYLEKERGAVFEFAVGDENLLPTQGTYDLAICSLVLMMVNRRQRLRRIMVGLLQSLNLSGRLVLVVTHPMFRESRHRSFWNELPHGFSYRSPGTPYKVVFPARSRETRLVITDYHWRVRDYCEAIRDAGGRICDLSEVPGDADSDGKALSDPAYLIMVVRRSYSCTSSSYPTVGRVAPLLTGDSCPEPVVSRETSRPC